MSPSLPKLVPRLPERPTDSHKGMYGHALLLGGFKGMTGAIWIAGQSCLRGGAGLVSLALPSSFQNAIATSIPCAMTIGLVESSVAEEWYQSISNGKLRDATLAMGPGLGRCEQRDRLVAMCWREWPGVALFDADALNALSEIDAPQNGNVMQEHSGIRVLTPHPGEWERLSGAGRHDRKLQIERAKCFAKQWNAVIVLKGSRTYITNGDLEYFNETGNPSLAVGGSGDCLTGLITSMLCQGLSAMDAAILGVFLHGLAADITHKRLGTPSSLATDLIDQLPAAFREYRLRCASQ